MCEYGLIECGACGKSVKRFELPDHHEECEILREMVSSQKIAKDGLTIDNLTKQVALLEVDLNKTKTSLRESEGDVRRVKQELREMQIQLEMRMSEDQEFDTDWDPEYNYGYSPSSIAQLASLVSRYLLNKPYYVDRNRIFNAVKRCYDYYHGYAVIHKMYICYWRLVMRVAGSPRIKGLVGLVAMATQSVISQHDSSPEVSSACRIAQTLVEDYHIWDPTT
ncbi:hypothetical protein OS493_005493 [Desmophyllum pertusum]|uniref:Uncharacterized protein n=1 Tax=Desmophyllum pertusum TaxID=174260 RepID=A0A9W9YSB9_9CNID|nr:hypothetical protein OS493_005493 [Desmophyllum pertusum]